MTVSIVGGKLGEQFLYTLLVHWVLSILDEAYKCGGSSKTFFTIHTYYFGKRSIWSRKPLNIGTFQYKVQRRQFISRFFSHLNAQMIM